jgi:hypothetical protein
MRSALAISADMRLVQIKQLGATAYETMCARHLVDQIIEADTTLSAIERRLRRQDAEDQNENNAT